VLSFAAALESGLTAAKPSASSVTAKKLRVITSSK
jgi:hypothetical protein